jgi:hypothetical protein
MEVVPNSISPLLPDFFFAAALATWEPLAPLIGSRFAAARDGFEPSELIESGEPIESAWPYVLFNPTEDGTFDQWAQTSTLLEAPFLIRAFMREDYALLRGEDFEDATAAIHEELQKALVAFGATEITRQNGGLRGTIHGCQLLQPVHRRVYGEKGRRISEMGVHVLLVCN